jgi:hypothetical protein
MEHVGVEVELDPAPELLVEVDPDALPFKARVLDDAAVALYDA